MAKRHVPEHFDMALLEERERERRRGADEGYGETRITKVNEHHETVEQDVHMCEYIVYEAAK